MSAVRFRQFCSCRKPLATISKMEMHFSPFLFAIFANSSLQKTFGKANHQHRTGDHVINLTIVIPKSPV